MSARRLLALLVVVVLGLLLVNPAALSRIESPLYRADSWFGDTTNPNDDPDDDDPNGFVDGDDDNWDKPAGHGHRVAEAREATQGAGTDTSEDRLSRTEVGLRFTLLAVLRACFSLMGPR